MACYLYKQHSEYQVKSRTPETPEILLPPELLSGLDSHSFENLICSYGNPMQTAMTTLNIHRQAGRRVWMCHELKARRQETGIKY